ncbi:MAG: L,D-transpeptidase [Pseudanabaenaceae cyanobacterium bins.68]|nr:L,D-transpeptidase [Pseudanabaenaceae cyanobacterium bins.68]
MLGKSRLLGLAMISWAIATPILSNPDLVTRLEVSLQQRRVIAFQGDRVWKSFRLGVGKAGWETPKGTYRVRQLIQNPAWKNPFTGDVVAGGDRANPLGKHWIGFWTNGRDWSGFHGTNDPSSVGQATSHGCLRMLPQEIAELFPLLTRATTVQVKP